MRTVTSMNLQSVDLTPMPIDLAKKLVKRLIAGYPLLNAHDPKGYAEALVQVMSEYPQFAGEQAIVKVDEEKPEFPPSDRVLRTWLENAVRPYRFKQEWEARAKVQLAERAAWDAAQPEYKPDPNIKTYTNFTEAVRAHGRPIGVFEPGRDRPYRGG